jgi:hypothetical protein
LPETLVGLEGRPLQCLKGVSIVTDNSELLDWVSPRKQREIDNQAAFLRYLMEREDTPAEGGEKR